MLDPSIFTSVIESYLPEPHSSLLNGIIFGIDLKVDRNFYTAIKHVGLLHMVVLSGTNIQILAGIVATITRDIGKVTSSLITILIIIIFTIFVSPEAPIIRAAFMSILTLVSITIGRKPLALYLLFISGLFTLLIWPEWVTSISFQLSYAATLGLILFSKKKDATTAHVHNKFLAYLQDEFRTSMAAQVFTVPIIFIYFKEVSFISPLANILVSWLVAPLMIIGALASILGKLYSPLGYPFALLAYGLLHYLVLVIETLAQIPYSFISFK